jgi:hypothetical protein
VAHPLILVAFSAFPSELFLPPGYPNSKVITILGQLPAGQGRKVRREWDTEMFSERLQECAQPAPARAVDDAARFGIDCD